MKHHCHVYGCKTEVPPRLLMCARHWSLVPDVMKDLINRSFSTDQCKNKGARPSLTWLKAARAAINYVQDVEKGIIA